jgi:nitrate reductase molybdenum cofactor assembly chaperone NarJ/NarW
MMLFYSIKSYTYTIRLLAALLRYPDAELRGWLPQMKEVLNQEQALSPARQAEITGLIHRLMHQDALDVESNYVQLFDHSRAASLHLFEHVHGDSRERGPALIDLAQTYEKAGLYLAPGELPDYLPVVLEFASTQPPHAARAFLSEIAHILCAIFSALQQRDSAYASVIGALLELAGEKAQAVKLAPEEALDESWAEPPVFGGCSSKGQSKPGQPQPVHIIRNPRQSGATK